MSLVDEPAVQPVERHNHSYAAPPEPFSHHHDDEELPHGESDRVRNMLDKTDWNVTKSARLLGLTRDMLRYRIEKLGLTRPDKRHW
ncbi:Bacterial regulatory protein, Fis family [compost metagenome]